MKRILSFILTVCILVSVFSLVLSVPAAALSHIEERNSGLEFSTYSSNSKSYGAEYYEASKHLESVPHTFEAWVKMSTNRLGKEQGVILGSHASKSGGRFKFSVSVGDSKQFVPKLEFYDKSGATHSVNFNTAAIDYYGWHHVVVVFDEDTETFRAYINGELKQTVEFSKTCTSSKCDNGCIGIFSLQSAKHFPVCLGGDLNSMNPNFFWGKLQDVAMYEDVLSDDEIKGNYQNGVNVCDENLILYYDINDSDRGKDIVDASGNGYDLSYSKVWLTEEEMQALREEKGFAKEYAYSLAIIGDPQYATRKYPEVVKDMYQWIADNREEKDIKYVIGLGDITDQCQLREWEAAADALSVLEKAGIEYSLVRGNHDVATVGGIDKENYGATAVPEKYDELFYGNDFYRSQFENYGGFYQEGSVINTYRTLSIEGDNWLIVNLDFQADKAIRDWAGEVIKNHPEHRTIIVTHEYLGAHGNPSTYGAKLWNEVASQYKNVELVLGGHVSFDNIKVRQTQGVHGNTVTQMLIDAQNFDRDQEGGVGIVTMFYFREDGTVFDVEHYSTAKKMYMKNINQITVDLRAESQPEVKEWNGTDSKAPSGTGTKSDPYLISSAQNLLWMAEALYAKSGDNVVVPTTLINAFDGKYFVQTCDIDLYDCAIPSIGYYFGNGVGSVFGGSYDGGGYTIRNGKIFNPLSSEKLSVGLFGEMYGASVSNLTLREIKVDGEFNSGILAGRATNSSIENCKTYYNCKVLFVNGEENTKNAKALVGKLVGGKIVNSESEQLAALVLDGAIIVSSKGSYNKADGTVVHTAIAFTYKNEQTHTANCTCGCGEVIELGHIRNAYGYCEQCQVKISGASVSIGSDIAIKYYVDVFDSAIISQKALSMRFGIDGKTVTVTDYKQKDGRYIFTLDGILPQQMGELIDATLILGAGENAISLTEKNGYSIKEYCTDLIEASQSDELTNLLWDLLSYGTEAQRYLEYKTDRFLSGGLVLPVRDSLPTEEDKRSITNNKNENCKVTSAPKITFDGKAKIEIRMLIADISLAEIYINGEKHDNSNLIDLGDGVYLLTFDEILSQNINQRYEIQFLYAGGEATRIVTGINSHLYTMIRDKAQIEEDKANHKKPTKEVNEEEYSLFVALYRFGISASAYFETITQEAGK